MVRIIPQINPGINMWGLDRNARGDLYAAVKARRDESSRALVVCSRCRTSRTTGDFVGRKCVRPQARLRLLWRWVMASIVGAVITVGVVMAVALADAGDGRSSPSNRTEESREAVAQ